MPKAKNKEELLEEMRKEREALEKFLSTLTPEQMVQPGAIGEWSPKDVLAHLAEWEQMCLGWYSAGKGGEIPPLPAEGYKWSQMSRLNQQIYEKYHSRSLEDTQRQFQFSYRQISRAVQEMSEEELFTPGYYVWTGKNTLATYVAPCTSEHYHWARIEMRKWLKAVQKPA